jgi:hypothetical protein
MDHRRDRLQFQTGVRNVSLLLSFQTCSGAHTASSPAENKGSALGWKSRGVKLSSLSNAEVKNAWRYSFNVPCLSGLVLNKCRVNFSFLVALLLYINLKGLCKTTAGPGFQPVTFRMLRHCCLYTQTARPGCSRLDMATRASVPDTVYINWDVTLMHCSCAGSPMSEFW